MREDDQLHTTGGAEILGLVGKAGSGKDTAADLLVHRYGYTKIALADPIKRFLADLFGWPRERLWGPSAERAVPDPTWILPGGDPLTTRFGLTSLGTGWGRTLVNEHVWVRYLFRVMAELRVDAAGAKRFVYDPYRGIAARDLAPKSGSIRFVVPDVRYLNEALAILSAGGALLRIRRPGAGLAGRAAEHTSETDQDGLPDEIFSAFLNNAGTKDDLLRMLDSALARPMRRIEPWRSLNPSDSAE